MSKLNKAAIVLIDFIEKELKDYEEQYNYDIFDHEPNVYDVRFVNNFTDREASFRFKVENDKINICTYGTEHLYIPATTKEFWIRMPQL